MPLKFRAMFGVETNRDSWPHTQAWSVQTQVKTRANDIPFSLYSSIAKNLENAASSLLPLSLVK